MDPQQPDAAAVPDDGREQGVREEGVRGEGGVREDDVRGEGGVREDDVRGEGLREQEVLAVLPRLTQIGSIMNRGRLIERAMEAAAIHVDRPAMGVLLSLHTAARPLRIGEIAARMQVVGPHVTRQVNELERRGLVVRVTDPDDQRARLIEATPDGAKATERYVGTIIGWFADALADWPQQDRQDFGRLLGRFADDVTARLVALDNEPPPTAE
ncbi:MarR family transcriptional regulator [Streptomyces sp. NPDC093109]|uniref:MarR family winged helix-turn-helix transcriptional regulator n=1 Tax=Streptomyces sp. NPDC093109 TaxID=3154977 RepID=UPI00344EC49E